jgi:hypothetical protein
MAQVINAHLHLEAVFGHALFRREQTGVVDKHIQAIVAVKKRGSEITHALQAGKIHRQVDRRHRRTLADDLERLHRLLGVTAGQHNLGAHTCQFAGGHHADATVTARDQNSFAAQIRHVLSPVIVIGAVR